MAEDNSFKATDRAKFRGYLRGKWKTSRMPILMSMFLDILQPAKFLSLAFQDDEIDPVKSSQALQDAQSHLSKLERKSFQNLPHVKFFLSKVKSNDEGQHEYQDVIFTDFQESKRRAIDLKDNLVELVNTSISERLEKSTENFEQHAAVILNTECWPKVSQKEDEADGEFADGLMEEVYERFAKPLKNAGFSGTLPNLLQQWHSVIAYTKKYLASDTTNYLVVWYCIFNSSLANRWKLVLLVIELLFCIPISNAKVERLFSLIKRMKTDGRSSLGNDRLNSLLKIQCEGVPLKQFEASSAVELWANAKVRRPDQHPRKKYKKRQSKKAKPILSMSDSERIQAARTSPRTKRDGKLHVPPLPIFLY